MSTLESKMAALTGGNSVDTAKLLQLFGPADVGSGGGTTRRVDTAPELRTKPGLN